MPIVRFAGSDKSIEVGKGSNLRRSLQLHGIVPYTGIDKALNCHGLGLCGTCWIEVVEGDENLSPPSKMEQINIKRPLKRGRRLSCQTRVYGDCVIRTNQQAAADRKKK